LPASVFWLNQLVTYLITFTITAFAGLLVERWGVRVSYTRKIMHFSYYFVPLILDALLPYEATPVAGLLRLILVTLSFLGLARPVRERVRLFRLMWVSVDRPEDRPHTLRWLITQLLAGVAVIAALQVYLEGIHHLELLTIPTIVNVFGDGLAEPVGVRFGRRRYHVRALFSDQRYTRSDAGSLCVFVSGVVAVLLLSEQLSAPQLWVGLAVIPLLMMLTEALSPHTWDTPFLFLVGGFLSLGLVWWVP
jgi:dolichol kinase